MFKKIKAYLESFRKILGTKEVQPLTAKNAQSMQYYGSNYDFDTMISLFKINTFNKIKETVSNSNKNYCIIERPKWLSKELFNDFMLELIQLEYKVRKIEEISISVIFWNE